MTAKAHTHRPRDSRSRRSSQHRQTAHTLHAQGVGIAAIAKVLDVQPATVRRWLNSVPPDSALPVRKGGRA